MRRRAKRRKKSTTSRIGMRGTSRRFRKKSNGNKNRRRRKRSRRMSRRWLGIIGGKLRRSGWERKEAPNKNPENIKENPIDQDKEWMPRCRSRRIWESQEDLELSQEEQEKKEQKYYQNYATISSESIRVKFDNNQHFLIFWGKL